MNNFTVFCWIVLGFMCGFLFSNILFNVFVAPNLVSDLNYQLQVTRGAMEYMFDYLENKTNVEVIPFE